ncbi:MAG: hypothetical protein RLZZ94_612 [Bacteroidota bacterium]
MFAPQLKGRVAERLGRGLQNLVQRFKSARDLRNPWLNSTGDFYFTIRGKSQMSFWVA